MQAYLDALDEHIVAVVNHNHITAPLGMGVEDADPEGTKRLQEESTQRVKKTRFAMRQRLEKLLSK